MIAGDGSSARSHFSLDRTRSILVSLQGIKRKKIIFPPWKVFQPLLTDILALQNEQSESRMTGTVFLLSRKAGMPDDFAHAFNYAMHLLVWIIGNDTGDRGAEYQYLLSSRNTSLEALIEF